MTNLDLIIFDCDGVLVDSEMLAGTALAELLTGHGLETSLADVLDRYLGRSMAVVEQDYLARTGNPLPQDFAEQSRALLARSFADRLQPIAGIAALLDSLHLPYCLASSSGRERIDLSLQVTGLAHFFEGRIFNAAMVKRGKPAPDLFLHAARVMGVDPSRALVIEDSPAGVQAGKSAGMRVWGFVGGTHYSHLDGRTILAAAGADRVIGSMAEFAAEMARLRGPADGSFGQ